MVDYNVTGKIDYSGGTQAAREIDKTSQALDKNAKAADQASKATKTAGDTTKAAATNYGQFGSAVGLAASSVSKLSPALGSVVGTAGQALGAIQALTTAGFGPMGLALAGVSIAITAATSLYRSYQDSLETATDKVKENTIATDLNRTSLRNNMAALDDLIAKRRQEIADTSRQARIALGGGTQEENIATVARATTALAEAQAAATAASNALARATASLEDAEGRRGGGVTNIAALTSASARADNELNQARRRLTVATNNQTEAEQRLQQTQGQAPTSSVVVPHTPPHRAATRRAPAGPGNAGEMNDFIRDVQALRNNSALEERAIQDRDNAIADAAQEAADEQARLDDKQTASLQASLDERARLAEEYNKRNIENIKATADEEILIKADAATELINIQSAVADASSLANDLISMSAEAAGASQEEQTRIMAGAALAEAVVQGALQIAAAAGSYPDVVGMVQHGISAVAYGVAAGKAAGVMGGGGGVSSGTSGGPSTSSASGGPSAGPGGNNDRSGETIIINIGGPKGAVYTADKNKLYSDIDEGISQARARTRRGSR